MNKEILQITNNAFKTINKKSIKILSQFYSNLEQPLADINPLMMVSWSNQLSLEYLIKDSKLFVIGYFDNIPYLWGPPLGNNLKIDDIFLGINIINKLRNNKNSSIPQILYLWDKYELFEEVKNTRGLKIQNQAKEYIYSCQDLSLLNVPELKSKRKSKRRFANKYSPVTKLFDIKYKKQIISLIKKWEKQKTEKIKTKDFFKFKIELNVCLEAIKNDLPFEGVLIFVNNKLCAFSIGYEHTNNTFNCMFEKTDLSMPDASTYVFSELGRIFIGKYQYINAGEDWGVEYLEKTKNKWYPSMINHSYSIIGEI